MAEVALLATGLAAEVAPVVAAPAILAVAVAVAVAHRRLRLVKPPSAE